MKEYTYDDVLPIIEEIVAAKGPDYVYEKVNDRCVYMDEQGKPSCLVGYFLAHQSLIYDLSPHEYEEEGASNVLNTLAYNDIAYFDSEADDFLQIVQEKQDAGVPWGQAVDFAVTVISNQRANSNG